MPTLGPPREGENVLHLGCVWGRTTGSGPAPAQPLTQGSVQLGPERAPGPVEKAVASGKVHLYFLSLL